MYHQDYFIRMLQQFVVFLAGLLGLKEKNDPDLVQIELDRAMKMFLGFDQRGIDSLTPEALFALSGAGSMADPEERDPYRVYMGSILLLEQGELYAKTGFQERSLDMARKCRYFLDRLDPSIIPEEAPGVQELEKRLALLIV